MQELVEYLAKSLVASPEDVRVEEVESGRQSVYELTVAPSDMGKIIGKGGRTAKALRTLLKVAATKQGKRAILEIL